MAQTDKKGDHTGTHQGRVRPCVVIIRVPSFRNNIREISKINLGETPGRSGVFGDALVGRRLDTRNLRVLICIFTARKPSGP